MNNETAEKGFNIKKILTAVLVGVAGFFILQLIFSLLMYKELIALDNVKIFSYVSTAVCAFVSGALCTENSGALITGIIAGVVLWLLFLLSGWILFKNMPLSGIITSAVVILIGAVGGAFFRSFLRCRK